MQLEDYESKSVIGRISGVFPQDRQLVTLHPTNTFDIDQSATVGAARGAQCCEPGTSVYCKLGNIGSIPFNIDVGRTVAKLVTVNCTDEERFYSLFNHIQETDLPSLSSDGVVLSMYHEARCDTAEQRGAIDDLSDAKFG